MSFKKYAGQNYFDLSARELTVASLFVFFSGHSHILKVMHDKELDIMHMNPGAIGNYGWHKVKTILAFTVNGKEIKDLRVIEFTRGKN